MKKITENNLQAECFKWANNNFCLKHHNPRLTIFSVPNGGTRNKLEALTLQSTGLRSGVADLIALYPNGKCVFFELKTDKGIQSEVQKDFENVVKALGFDYHICRTFDEFRLLFTPKQNDIVINNDIIDL